MVIIVLGMLLYGVRGCLNTLLKKPLEGFRSAGFQPASSLGSINAGKMPALQSASRYFFSNRLDGTERFYGE